MYVSSTRTRTSIIAKTFRVSLSSIANKYSQNDTVDRTTKQSCICPPSCILQSISRILPKAKDTHLSSCPSCLLPLPPLKNLDDSGTAALHAIPAVALSFSPPDSSLRLVARLRWCPKRLAPRTRPIPTSLPVRFAILRSPALSFLQLLREHGPVPMLLTLRSPMRLDRVCFL